MTDPSDLNVSAAVGFGGLQQIADAELIKKPLMFLTAIQRK